MAGSESDLPFVSVVMPVRNEADHIGSSLGAVLEQDYPVDKIEVIVVDGVSEDATSETVRRLAETARTEARPAVTLISNPSKVVPVALNRALTRARGEVIVRVDGHAEIASDYVRRCVETLERTGASNVGGVQRAVGRTLIGRAIAIATSSRFGAGDARFRYAKKEGWVDTVYLGAFPKSIFDQVGVFDEDLTRNQDDEFNLRVRRAGGRIFLDPAIRSVYRPREALGDVWRQYFEYGLYKLLVMRKHRRVASWRHLVPSAFVVALLASLVASIATRRPILSLIVAGPYLAADVIASVVAGRREPACLPALLLVFPIVHLAYGLGLIAGLWRWRHLPRQQTGGG
ncbi:MAG: glycosyltransferase family 2 protein [Actinomycetota bacterium]